MKQARLGVLVAVVFALLMAADQRAAHAGIITGTVSLDTSGLSGPFELAFILTDGSGAGDGNNTVTLSDFLFGSGGSAGAVDTLLSFGGASGNLISGASLVDSSFANIFASTFTAGSLLTFHFGLTTNVDAGGTPDQLSFALLRADGSVVNTTDPSGANSLLTVNVDSAHPTFSTFASDLTPAPLAIQSATAPEPSSVLLLAISLIAAARSLRRRAPSLRRRCDTPVIDPL